MAERDEESFSGCFCCTNRHLPDIITGTFEQANETVTEAGRQTDRESPGGGGGGVFLSRGWAIRPSMENGEHQRAGLTLLAHLHLRITESPLQGKLGLLRRLQLLAQQRVGAGLLSELPLQLIDSARAAGLHIPTQRAWPIRAAVGMCYCKVSGKPGSSCQ